MTALLAAAFLCLAVACFAKLRAYWAAEEQRIERRITAFWAGVAVGRRAYDRREAIAAPNFADDEAGAAVRYWWEGARRAAVGRSGADLDSALESLLHAEHFEVEVEAWGRP